MSLLKGIKAGVDTWKNQLNSSAYALSDMSCPIPDENPIILNLTSTSGALLFGSFLSCVVWGASSFQTFLYFMNYESDPTSLKVMVSVLWVLDTANEILVLKSNWLILILEYGRISNLTVSQPELMHHTWVEAMVVFAVQSYFIRRIYLFTKKKWLFPACLVILSSWQLIGTVVYQIIGYGRPLATLSTQREVGINMSLRGAAVVVDVAVTISMVYLLVRQDAPSIGRSKRMIHRLLLITINSGMTTAIVASIVLILLAAQPDNLYYCMAELLLCSLYFSTFLANLNARRFVTGDGGVTTISNFTDGRGNDALILGPMSNRSETLRGTDNPPPKVIFPVHWYTGHFLNATGAQESEVVIKIQTDMDTKVDEAYPSRADLSKQSFLVHR
ncbi:hypothetical protein EW146_g254 [Bondarzewia mesenterica]|uniref:DUF6534 domain-containing protein n=1 Tax=Bondarzewia mesenterica TaxID=1095465 RepID=A0A4V3XGG7_9AGAM|nr:hypothetical protein EW146_g254 [Bondarzewia mesenterica]